MNILVTGSDGQLGSEIKELAIKYKKLNFTYTDIDNLDITKFEQLKQFINKNSFDYIINCAGYTNVDKAESETGQAWLINSLATRHLVRVSKIFSARLIHISTDYVFDGNNNKKPYTEDDTPNPLSQYGKSKLEGEKEVKTYDQGLIIRTSWLYSSYGFNFVKTMLKIGKEHNEVKVINDQIGSPTYAADLAEAILTIIDSSTKDRDKFQPGIYHYSNEGVCSWFDFAREIMKIAGIKCTVKPINTIDYQQAAKRPYYSVLSKNKIKQVYNIYIPYWKDSLEKCIRKIHIA
jgi:dTDP-4-dehydrorhamnose reductase